jgi:hypothetical protein
MTTYIYCHTQKKVVPIEELPRESKAINYMSSDEMAPTRNPLNPREVYTSKSKLRAVYKAAGAVEVGDSYDRGYVPPKERGSSEKVLLQKVKHEIAERLKYGRK